MDNKGISIIIPCYNGGKFIKEAINSIFIQPITNPFEIIIVDDCSTDRLTAQTLADLESQPKIRIIRHPQNMGGLYARKTGAENAKYRYVTTLDSDDLINSDPQVLKDGTYFDRAIEILESSPDYAFVHPLTYMFGEFSGYTISAYPVTEALVLKKHHAPTCLVHRKCDVEKAQDRDLEVTKWVDWTFTVGILNNRFKAGKKNKVGFVESPSYLYRIHTTQDRVSTKSVSERDMVEKTITQYPEIFRNYYPQLSDAEIVEFVAKSKPDRLKDLLFVANNNLERALQMVEERGIEYYATRQPNSIP